MLSLGEASDSFLRGSRILLAKNSPQPICRREIGRRRHSKSGVGEVIPQNDPRSEPAQLVSGEVEDVCCCGAEPRRYPGT